MGSDDLFKKRREQRQKRKYEFRTPKANSFLIITEGERTEPLYFKGLQMQILEKIGGRVDVVEVPIIDISGEGCSTERLIEAARQTVKNAKIVYQNIWLVFDKDDFSDFDQAIEDCIQNGYHVAWSNQSFEYWLYLHFQYSDAALHRDRWIEKLNEIFQEYHLGKGKYYKNYEDIYSFMDKYDGVNTAIKFANRRMSEFDESKCKPSEFDPGTTVYILVRELKKYLD